MASADFENGPPLEGEHTPTIQLAAMNSAEKEKVHSLHKTDLQRNCCVYCSAGINGPANVRITP